MPTAYSDYLNTHYSPMTNAIGMWLNNQEAARVAEQLRIESLLRQQAASRAAAQQASKNGSELLLPPVLSSATVAPAIQETPGFFEQVIKRGLPNFGATMLDAAALAGDLLGNKEWAQDVHDDAARMRRNAELAAPRQVANFSDIENLSDLGTYALETLADQIPNLAAFAATGGLGGIASRGAASLASRLGAEAASKSALATATNVGRTAGAFGAGTALEAGSAYGTDIERHGIEGTNPLADLATGAVAGTIETAMGVPARLLRGAGSTAIADAGRALTAKELNNITKLANRNALSTAARGAVGGAAREGSTEALQELVQVTNEALQDDTRILTPETLARMGEAFAAGGILGGPLGPVGSLSNRRSANRFLAERESLGIPTGSTERAKTDLEIAAEQLDMPSTVAESTVATPMTPVERQAVALDQTRNMYSNALDNLNTVHQQSLSAIDQNIQGIQAALAASINNPQATNSLQKQLTTLVAQRTKLQEQYNKQVETVTKQQETDERNITKRAIKDTVSSTNVTDPRTVYDQTTTLLRAADEAAKYNTVLDRIMSTKSKTIDSKINDLTRKLSSMSVTKAPVVRKMYEDQIKALRNERKQLTTDWRKSKALVKRIRDNANKLDVTKYSPDEALVDLSELRSFGNMQTAGTSADTVTLKYLQDGLKKARTEAIKNRTAARREKYADRKQVENRAYSPSNTDLSRDFIPESTPSIALPANTGRQALEIADVQAARRQANTFVDGSQLALPPAQGVAYNPEAQQLLRESMVTRPYLRPNPEAIPMLPSTEDIAQFRPVPNPITRATEKYTEDTAKKQAIAQKQIENAIKPTLKMLPKLEGVVSVVTDTENPLTGNLLGSVDASGNITLNAPRIIEEAKNTKKSVKEVACRTLVHEGITHYGLRVLFNDAQLNKFLNIVNDSFRDTRLWNTVTSKIENFGSMDSITQSEEFLARYSERMKVANLLKEGKSAWEKIKGFMRSVLRRLGFTKITEQDIRDVFSAAAYKLSNDYTSSVEPRAAFPETGLARSIDSTLESMTRTERAEAEAAQRFPFFNQTREAFENRQELKEAFLEKFVDSYRPVEQMIRKLKGMGRKEDGTSRIHWNTNVYKLLQHLPGTQALNMQRATTQFVTPLEDLMLATAKPNEDAAVTFARCDEYVEALAAKERNEYAHDRGVDKPLVALKGQTYEEAQAHWQSIIDKYSSPEMNRVVDQLQKINNERLRILEENKILPKEVIDNWKKAYKVYMPFKSWENLVEEAAPYWYRSSTRKSLSTPNVQRKIAARATGREGQAQSPITHAILQMYDVIALQETVKTSRSLLQLAKDNSDAKDVLEVVTYRDPEDKTWGKPVTYTDPETGEQVTEVTHGAMKTVVDKKTGDISMKPTKHTAEGNINDTVAVIDEEGNVQRVWLKDPGVARALRGENIVRASGLIRSIGTLQHILGRYITSRNPLFWLTNPVRDVTTAALNIASLTQELQALGIKNPNEVSRAILKNGLGKVLSSNSVRNAIMYYRKYGTFSPVKGAKTTLSPEAVAYMSDYEQYLNYGGQTEYFGTNTYDALKKSLISALRDKNPVTQAQKVKAILNEKMQLFDEISGSLENMTRYIAFKEIVDRLRPFAEAGRTADGRPFSTAEMYSRAANIALNLTVNFSRKGSWAPVFNSLYMFASASIGGNVRMLETLFRKDRYTGKTDWRHVSRFLMYPLAAYTIQALIARALMPDDDDGVNTYDKIPEYIKSSNIIIPSPSGDGDYLTIPLPYGFNIFWNIAQKVVDSASSYVTGAPGPSLTNAATNIFTTAFDNFATIGGSAEGWTAFVPSFFRPLVQLANNKNFAGNPIMPAGNENLRGRIPDYEKYWSTASPTIIWLCKTMSPILDVSPESIEHLSSAYLGGLGRITFGALGALEKWALGDFSDLHAGDIPGLKVFYKNLKDSDTSALFSTYRTEALTEITAVDDAKTNPNLSPQARANIFMENRTGYALKAKLRSVQQKLNDLREQERKLLQHSNISSSTKNKMLDRIREAKQRYMKQFIRAANMAGLRPE